MQKVYTEYLLEDAGLSLTGMDAARLVLELVEEMPELRASAQKGKNVFMQALRRVLRAGVETVREREKTVSFEFAAEDSLECRVKAGRRPTTLRDLRHFIRRMLRVPGVAQKPLRMIAAAECRKVLEQAFAGSGHSFRKGRAILHGIFAHGVRMGWCSVNPVSGIEVPLVEEREIVPLSVAECHRLLKTAQSRRFRDCLPALGLMLFAGVRPGEVARLSWKDVHSEEGFLSVSVRHSKTGGARRVELCSSLCRMLLRQRPAEAESELCSLCPSHWRERWKQLRIAAGFGAGGVPWVPDVLRHTFASYHAMTYRNLPLLQLQLGHRDARLLFTRYLNLGSLSMSESKSFWKLAG